MKIFIHRNDHHHNINDLIWRGMTKAEIPALKDPSGLLSTRSSLA